MKANIPPDQGSKKSLKIVTMANSGQTAKLKMVQKKLVVEDKASELNTGDKIAAGQRKSLPKADSDDLVKEDSWRIAKLHKEDETPKSFGNYSDKDTGHQRGQSEDMDEEDYHSQPKDRLQKLKSSVSAVFEFGDDEDNERKMKSMNNDYFFLEYEANYDIKVYFEFLMYHVLYFSGFGPVIALFFLLFPKTRQLMSNLMFLRLSNAMFIQLLAWLNFAGVVLIMIFVNNPISRAATLLSAVLSIIMRSSNIAAKYATFPKKLIQKYRDQQLSTNEIRSDFLLGAWAVQGSELIDTEITNALLRNNFDVTLFKLSFLAKVSKKFEDEIQAYSEDVICSKPWKDEITMQCEKVKSYYCGHAIFAGIVRVFNKMPHKDLTFRTPIIVITAGLNPLWTKLFLERDLMNSESIPDTVVFYFNCLMNMLLFYFTSLFFGQAKKDIRRITFAMHQLSHLISTQRHSKEIIKILPTVNFLEELSLNSWKIMRRVAIDYGKKYFYRHELYLPVVFVLAIICLMTTLIL